MTSLLRYFDCETDLHRLHAANPQRYPFLLETVAHGIAENRYDILFACPGDSLLLDNDGVLHSGDPCAMHTQDGDFLAAFDEWWRTQRQPATELCDIPFSGGWFVYLGYELAQQIEPRLQLPKSGDDLPVACATRIPAALIRDHRNQQTIAVAESDGTESFQIICEDLERLLTNTNSNSQDEPVAPQNISSRIQEDPPGDYLQAVNRIKQYIRDGDVFQVNLSRQWQAILEPGVSHNQLYTALRQNNPAPFFGLVTFPAGMSGHVNYADTAILSSSPERLVRVQGNKVETRPVAGTRPRGQNEDADVLNQTELMAHPKERAEHIMLIDLERNDLGRVCEPGSVQVNELMALESYAHVHHIVSNVCGTLRKAITPGDIIRAVFPGGTITGCPKIRCMEIIAELEDTGRGAYTGSMGYVNHNGDMDFNILIRTMVKKDRRLTLRAGAGIVADSIPEKELDETRAKARGLLLTLDIE